LRGPALTYPKLEEYLTKKSKDEAPLPSFIIGYFKPLGFDCRWLCQLVAV
jgi:hypothetical protein